MGNRNSKDPNKARVVLELSDYTISSLPSRPSKLNGRYDHEVWHEFISVCEEATKLDDIEERKEKDKRATCCQSSGFVFLMVGIILGGLMGGLGGGFDITGLWIAGVVIGGLGFFGGLIWAQGSIMYIQSLKEQYAKAVKNKLDNLLIPINGKYGGKIQYSTRIKWNNHAQNALTERINIDIVINVDFVKYLKEMPKPQIQSVQTPQGTFTILYIYHVCTCNNVINVMMI